MFRRLATSACVLLLAVPVVIAGPTLPAEQAGPLETGAYILSKDLTPGVRLMPKQDAGNETNNTTSRCFPGCFGP